MHTRAFASRTAGWNESIWRFGAFHVNTWVSLGGEIIFFLKKKYEENKMIWGGKITSILLPKWREVMT